MRLQELTPAVHEKVWGSPRTEPWFVNPEGRKIGEIWFAAPETLPVLVKLLFTSDRLSVQVHPDDAYARKYGAGRGKTEMWHVLRAEPGSTVALGLRDAASREELSAAALDGGIVDRLRWLPACAGDAFFVPAGTIHAIGAGLVLCEVQQFSDVTYRLFDYQREPKRELHLKDSLAVADLGAASAVAQAPPVECAYFRTERFLVRGARRCGTAAPAIFTAVAGSGQIDGEPFRPGQAWLALGGAAFVIESPDAEFVMAADGVLDGVVSQ